MIAQVHPKDFAQWLNSVRALGEPIVLDVREPHELQIASVTPDGFTLLTIPMGSIPARLTELAPGQPIACLCHHGARSLQVANFLQSQGFEHLVNIDGGIHAWSAEIDPGIALY